MTTGPGHKGTGGWAEIWRRLSIRQTTRLLIMTFLAAITLILAGNTLFIDAILARVEDAYDLQREHAGYIDDLLLSHAVQRTTITRLRGQPGSGEIPELVTVYGTSEQAIADLFDKIKNSSHLPLSVKEQLRAAKGLHTEIHAADRRVIQAVTRNQGDPARLLASAALERRDAAFINHLSQARQALHRFLGARKHQLLFMVRVGELVAGLIALLMMGLPMWIFYRALHHKVLLPMEKAAGHARRIAAGDLDSPLDLDASRGEPAALVSALEHMRRELRRSTEKLQTQTRRNQMILSAAGDGIFGVDLKGFCTFINPAASDMLGWPAEEFIGLRVHEIIHHTHADGRDYEFDECPITRTFQDGTLHAVSEDMFWRRDGSGIPVGYSATPIIENDLTIGAVVVFRDRTGQRQIQAELIQSSKLATLGEMTTSIAHELTQPLNVIRLASENIRRKLARQPLDPEAITEKIGVVSANLDRAAAIIDHMRVFGRKAGNRLAPVALDRLIDDTLKLVGQQLRTKLIEVAVRVEDGLPPVLANQIQLEQVLINLITNASDSIAGNDINRSRLIEIAADRDPREAGRLRLSVSDSGEGIPTDIIDRLFEPFFTTKEVGQGTGLGLSISYGLISEMNGTLIAENIDAGARFTISLPAAEAQDGANRPA